MATDTNDTVDPWRVGQDPPQPTVPRRVARRRRVAANSAEDSIQTGSDTQLTAAAENRAARKVLLIEAMLRNNCAVTASCRAVGIDTKTYYMWCESDKEFRESMRLAQISQFDFVESKLMERITGGDTRAITFYLKTKGAKHGYGENVTVSAPDSTVATPFSEHADHVDSSALVDIINRIVTHRDEFSEDAIISQ